MIELRSWGSHHLSEGPKATAAVLGAVSPVLEWVPREVQVEEVCVRPQVLLRRGQGKGQCQ